MLDPAMGFLPTAAYAPTLAQQSQLPQQEETIVYETFVASLPSQTGRVAIVTGSNTGLGFWAARALAFKGARVILACRDQVKAEAARKEIVGAVEGAPAGPMPTPL